MTVARSSEYVSVEIVIDVRSYALIEFWGMYSKPEDALRLLAVFVKMPQHLRSKLIRGVFAGMRVVSRAKSSASLFNVYPLRGGLDI